jgi:hypothetical protein
MGGDQGDEVPVEFQDSTQQPGPSGEAEEPTAAEAEDDAAEAWAAGHLVTTTTHRAGALTSQRLTTDSRGRR